MTTVTLEPNAYARITNHLRNHDTEQVIFLFFSRTATLDGDVFRVEDFYIVPSHELVHESPFHAEVSGDAQAKVIKMAWDTSLALGEIHSHPGCRRGTSFSLSDLAGFSEFVPHVRWRLKSAPYVALVFGDTDFDALAWINDPNLPEPVNVLEVGEQVYSPTGITVAELQGRMHEQERYERQIALFGAVGQGLLQKQCVAIVGLGGLGCHVAQQLAYLGVTRFVLIDEDVVDRSNLNRLVSATEKDIGRRKVDVTADFIKRIQPHATVTAIAHSFFSALAFAATENCDALVGCVDNDGVRLGLLEVCCASQKPYLDLATEVEPNGSFGGRFIFTGPGKGCPFCKDELDSKEVWRFFASGEQRDEDDRIYGVKRSALGGSGPSVVSLNGVIASLAVTEYAVFVTALRAPKVHLIYRGSMGVVTKVEAPASSCFYCGDIWNGRAKSDLSRFLTSSGGALPKSDVA